MNEINFLIGYILGAAFIGLICLIVGLSPYNKKETNGGDLRRFAKELKKYFPRKSYYEDDSPPEEIRAYEIIDRILKQELKKQNHIQREHEN